MKNKAAATVFGLFFVCLLASLHEQTQATAGAQAPSTAKPGISFKENEEIPEELRQKTFLFVWGKIRDDYYDSTFGGFDWNRVKERYAPRVAETKTRGEFHAMLGRMLAELGRSHLAIIAPHQMTREQKVAPEVRMTSDALYLSRAAFSPGSGISGSTAGPST